MKKIIFTLSLVALLFACSDDIATIPNEIEISEVEKEPSICLIGSESYAQFPGGVVEMMVFIGKNLRYPVYSCSDCAYYGRVTVRVLIDEHGAIDSVNVIRGIDPILDREAVRVIKSMPNWEPAKQHGIPVKSYYTIPILFRKY